MAYKKVLEVNGWMDRWMDAWVSFSLLLSYFSTERPLLSATSSRIAFYHLLSGLLLLWPASASFSVASATQFFSSRSHAANGSDSSRCSEHVSFLRFFLWTWALVRISQTSSSKSFTPLQRETFFNKPSSLFSLMCFLSTSRGRNRGNTDPTSATPRSHHTCKNTGFCARKCFHPWTHTFPNCYSTIFCCSHTRTALADSALDIMTRLPLDAPGHLSVTRKFSN